jgi:hypothetical protein
MVDALSKVGQDYSGFGSKELEERMEEVFNSSDWRSALLWTMDFREEIEILMADEDRNLTMKIINKKIFMNRSFVNDGPNKELLKLATLGNIHSWGVKDNIQRGYAIAPNTLMSVYHDGSIKRAIAVYCRSAENKGLTNFSLLGKDEYSLKEGALIYDEVYTKANLFGEPRGIPMLNVNTRVIGEYHQQTD